MELTISLEQAIACQVKMLTINRQKQVLDFVEFLVKQERQLTKFQHPDGRPMSALEMAGDVVGCVDDGPGDLATNKEYLRSAVIK